MMGILNGTNITIENLTQVANSSNFVDFAVGTDRLAFGGPVFWFIALWLIFAISFFAANAVKDQILNNLMYAGAFVSILAFLARAAEATNAVNQALISDHQMWVFPLITSVLAVIIWSIKD